MHDIKLVRAFDLAKGKARKTGTTFLVDALWPRGIKKQLLPLDVSTSHLLSLGGPVQGPAAAAAAASCRLGARQTGFERTTNKANLPSL